MTAGDKIVFYEFDGRRKTATVEVVDAKGIRVRVDGEHRKKRLRDGEWEVEKWEAGR